MNNKYILSNLGRIIQDPRLKPFSEADVSLNLVDIAMNILREEREKEALKNNPRLANIQEKNPPKVEDKTKAGDLPKAKKKIPARAPKSKNKKPKYDGKLSNFIPVDVKRDEKCEVPKVNLDGFDKKLSEEETEWDGEFNKDHVAKKKK